MKYDDIIEHLGEFRFYQKRLYFATCLFSAACAFQMFNSVFILAIPDHRCRLPSGYNDTSYYPTDLLTELYINHSIPMEDGQWSKCQRYDVNLTEITEDSVINGNANFSKKDCSEWMYDTSTFENTFMTEQNFVCEKTVYRSHANMIIMAGKMFGALVFGIISDIYGRKVVLVASFTIYIGSALALAFSPNFIAFAVFRCLAGVSTAGLFISALVIGIELVGKGKRTFTGIVIEFYWVGGNFILVLLAYFIREWNYLQLSLVMLSIPIVITLWIIPESPRWLLSRGKTTKAEAILREAAKVNKVDLPVKLFDTDTLDDGPQAKVWEMFTSPVLFLRCSVLVFNWIMIAMIYYGLSLYVNNLSGNIYINFTVSNIVELLGYLSCLILLDRIGRRAFLCVAMVGGGTSCILTLFPVLYGTESHEWITTTLSMVGKFGASAAFGVIFIFSSEIFPTVVRNAGVGFCSFSSRIGSMAAPYVTDLGGLMQGDLGKAVPLIVFGGCAVAAGLLALCLPETLNRDLPETIADAKRFGQKPTSKVQR